MNLNHGKHPHSQCLCTHASCQWYTCILKESETASNEGDSLQCHTNSNTEMRKHKKRGEERHGWSKGWCWKCLGSSELHDRCKLIQRESKKRRGKGEEVEVKEAKKTNCAPARSDYRKKERGRWGRKGHLWGIGGQKDSKLVWEKIN